MAAAPRRPECASMPIGILELEAFGAASIDATAEDSPFPLSISISSLVRSVMLPRPRSLSVSHAAR